MRILASIDVLQLQIIWRSFTVDWFQMISFFFLHSVMTDVYKKKSFSLITQKLKQNADLHLWHTAPSYPVPSQLHWNVV